ncbi:hypothetical protein Tco_1002258 [Tanacetum coccineum]|uniref:MAK10-like protein n=1 Tax=Tanacetum coccineum TaxID=301880 RepID=A0ABQ5F739_9ASTR
MNTPSKEDLDNLFGPMYEEFFEKRSSNVSINSAAQQVHNHEDSPSTSSIIIEDHEAPTIVTTSEEQNSPISLNEADEFNQEDSTYFDGNTVFVPYDAQNFEEAELSTTPLDLSNMHEFHQIQPSTHIWTKAHPLEQSIFSLCYLFRNPFSLTSMGDENHIRTLRDYSKPSHEGYRNTIELPEGNNVVPLRSDTICTSDRRLIELKNQVQRLMESHLAPKQHVQVNKITSSCQICSGPHDTQYCMENPEKDFVEYASLRTNEAGGKWYTFKPEQNNLGDTYNPSWKSHPNLRFSKFEADFKQQQSKMTNKIDTVLKAITDRITGALPSDTVKNLKLNVNSTSPVLSTRSYPTEDPQCSTRIYSSINAVTICPKQPDKSQNKNPEEEEREETDKPKNNNTNPSSLRDPSVSFIFKKNDDSREEEHEVDENDEA